MKNIANFFFFCFDKMLITVRANQLPLLFIKTLANLSLTVLIISISATDVNVWPLSRWDNLAR